MAKLAIDSCFKIIDILLQKCYKYYMREVINMLEEINVLREKLEEQVLENASYEEVLHTSEEIDNLLIKYYNSINTFKVLV